MEYNAKKSTVIEFVHILRCGFKLGIIFIKGEIELEKGEQSETDRLRVKVGSEYGKVYSRALMLLPNAHSTF